MSVQQGIFSAKLCEMEKQYEKFQAHLVTCQQMEHEAIREECRRMDQECMENEYILKQGMKGCRSRSARRLADIQLRRSGHEARHAGGPVGHRCPDEL